MEIIFYKSSNEHTLFPKKLEQGYPVQGNLRSECDILNPVITFEGNNFLNSYNYAYISDFKRYYFIDNITSIRNNLVEISFHVDVLNSWSNEILQHDALIERCEDFTKANFNLLDTKIITYPYVQEFFTYSLNPIKYSYAVNAHKIVDVTSSVDIELIDKCISPCVVIITTSDIPKTYERKGTVHYSKPYRYYNSNCSFVASQGNENVYVFNLPDFSFMSNYFLDTTIVEQLWGNDLNANSSFITGAYFCPVDLSLIYDTTAVNTFMAGRYSQPITSNFFYQLIGNDDFRCLYSYRLPINTIKNKSSSINGNTINICDSFIYYSPISEWNLNIPFYGKYTFNPLIYSGFYYIDIRAYLDVRSGSVNINIVGIPNDPKIPPSDEILIDTLTTNIYTPLNIGVGGINPTELSTINLIMSGLKLSLGLMTAGSTSTIAATSTISASNRTINPSTGRLHISSSKTINKQYQSTLENKPNYKQKIINEFPDGINNHTLQNNNNKIQSSTINSSSTINNIYCYLTCSTVKSIYPDNFAEYVGYLCRQTYPLNSISGLVTVSSIHLEIPCLSEEIDEIEDLLHSGVIIRGHLKDEVTS